MTRIPPLQYSNLLYYNNLKNCVDVYKEEGFPNFFDYVTLDRKKACRPWRCAEFSANKELVQAYVNCYPTAKQEMREFAMEALNFKCYFTWEGTGEFSQSLKETARLEAMAQELQEASGTGEPIQRNVHIIFVPKTEAELDGAKADVSSIIQMLFRVGDAIEEQLGYDQEICAGTACECWKIAFDCYENCNMPVPIGAWEHFVKIQKYQPGFMCSKPLEENKNTQGLLPLPRGISKKPSSLSKCPKYSV